MKTVRETTITRLLIVSAVASIALVPMIFYGCGPEWARWDATQANSYFLQGETSDALYQLRDAIQKSPRDPVLRLTLAERLIDIKKPEEALELTNEVLEVYPDNANAYRIKSLSQQHQGDFQGALRTQLEYDELHATRRSFSNLNQIAYLRALANEDLHLAKRDIETVVATASQFLNWNDSEYLTYPVKATVVACLVARCCDMNDAAIDAVSPQIDSFQTKIRAARNELTKRLYSETQNAFPIRENSGLNNRREQLRFYEQHAAVLLSCRALIYQDLGDLQRCQSDRLEVARLGFDSSKLAVQFPDEKTALNSLDTASAILDTRGFIRSLLPWIENDQLPAPDSNQANFLSSHANAVHDLNVAIFCVEAQLKSFECPLRNAIEFFQDRAEQQKLLTHKAAVLLYHRQLVHEKAGDLELAKADTKRIRELGIGPDEVLF